MRKRGRKSERERIWETVGETARHLTMVTSSSQISGKIVGFQNFEFQNFHQLFIWNRGKINRERERETAEGRKWEQEGGTELGPFVVQESGSILVYSNTDTNSHRAHFSPFLSLAHSFAFSLSPPSLSLSRTNQDQQKKFSPSIPVNRSNNSTCIGWI